MVVTRALRNSVLAPFLSVHQTWQERTGLRDRVARLQTERNELALSVITQAALAAGDTAKALLDLCKPFAEVIGSRKELGSRRCVP